MVDSHCCTCDRVLGSSEGRAKHYRSKHKLLEPVLGAYNISCPAPVACDGYFSNTLELMRHFITGRCASRMSLPEIQSLTQDLAATEGVKEDTGMNGGEWAMHFIEQRLQATSQGVQQDDFDDGEDEASSGEEEQPRARKRPASPIQINAPRSQLSASSKVFTPRNASVPQLSKEKQDRSQYIDQDSPSIRVAIKSELSAASQVFTPGSTFIVPAFGGVKVKREDGGSARGPEVQFPAQETGVHNKKIKLEHSDEEEGGVSLLADYDRLDFKYNPARGRYEPHSTGDI